VRKSKNMDVVIFCGGKGTRLSEETSFIPKPLVEIDERPILWHIMKHFSHYGHNRFILALGYKGDRIKQYFRDITQLPPIVEFKIGEGQITPISNQDSEMRNWEVVCVDTGLDNEKGSRLKQLQPFIKSKSFFVTYGDGVADINLDRLLEFYKNQATAGVLTGVCPPSRFGEIEIADDVVVSFIEKPQMKQGLVNGGYFIFDHSIFNYVEEAPTCDFEFGALQNFASTGGLSVYKHDGFWQCMDNIREKEFLKKLAKTNNAPWMIWKK